MSRLEPITRKEQVPAEHHAVFDAVVKSRGGVHGPFTMLMHCPPLAEHFVNIGGYIRFEGKLDKRVLHNAVRLLTGSAADFLDDYFDSELLKGYLEADADVRASAQEGEVRFNTVADNDKLAAILAAAVKHNIAIAEFKEVPMDLEDAFLEVTGMKARTTERADGRAVVA